MSVAENFKLKTVNQTPQAKDDVISAGEDTGASIAIADLLANDAGGNGKSFYGIGQADPRIPATTATTLLGGTITVSNGAITYASAGSAAIQALGAGETVVDTFTYTIRMGNGVLSTATVSITVTGTNDGPTIVEAATTATGAVAELADGSAGENSTVLLTSGSIGFADLDTNDVHSASVSAHSAGYLGGITLTAVDQGANSVGWTFSVPDSQLDALAAGETRIQLYDVSVSDGQGGMITKTVSVTITGTNDGPVAVADTATAVEDGGAVNIAVLANDTDVDAGDTKSVASVNTAGTVGSVSVNTDGSLSYNPGSNFQHLGAGETAVDSFTYTMKDASGATSTATVDVTVNGVNDAPSALNDNRSTNEDSSITINVLGNDSDVDGDALSLAGLSGSTSALGASISIVNGQVVYNAASSAALNALNTGQFATDSFTYSVSDGITTTTATVTVNVAGVSDSGAVNDTVSTGEDNRIYIDVLANDTSPNGKTIVGLNGTANGTATTALGAEIQIFNGQIFYNPQNAAGIQALNSGQTAVDTFTYTMRDGSGTLSQATVTVNVAGFTEGTIINSGVTATVTFNNANPFTIPQSYSEKGITVQSLYNPNSSPHLHFSTSNGDPSVELYNHSGCCSTPYEFRYFNPDNGDTTFSLQSFDHFGAGGIWTSSKGGSIVATAQGTVDFSSNPLFTDVEWIRWDPVSNSDYIDNFRFTG